MSNVIPIKGAQNPPRAVQSKMETIIVTPEMVDKWIVPNENHGFSVQRNLTLNAKVMAVSEEMKHTEVVPGILTLGCLRNNPSVMYIVDGQHRTEAFKLSELPEAIADVRLVTFDDMVEMGEEFNKLNSSLVQLKPDDKLRALEGGIKSLQQIRKTCEFVGYGSVRRSSNSGPIVSMGSLLRCWSAAQYDVPSTAMVSSVGGITGVARNLDHQSTAHLTAFLSAAAEAWGRDPQYNKLWGNLNMTICMWLYMRLVVNRERSGNKRTVVLNIPAFTRCLMSLSANRLYTDWLVGRSLNEHNRGPCYIRIKAIFVRRLKADTGKTVNLPQPAWAPSNLRSNSKAA